MGTEGRAERLRKTGFFSCVRVCEAEPEGEERTHSSLLQRQYQESRIISLCKNQAFSYAFSLILSICFPRYYFPFLYDS